jgi:hypothetical protein
MVFIPYNKRMTDDDEKFIIKKYQEGNSAKQILNLLLNKFKTTKTIYDILKKYNIQSHDPSFYNSVDHFYFSQIDTPEKAYVLGLMITDGWICNGNSVNQIAIGLKEEDKYIIESVKKEWKTENKLTYIAAKEKLMPNGKIYLCEPSYRIMVHSPKMIEDLKLYNVTIRKSFTTTLPIIKNYMGDLLRGILDGDGSIYLHDQTNKPVIRFYGSYFLIPQIALYFHLTLGIQSNLPVKRGNICQVEWYIKDEVIKIKEFLYQNKKDNYFLKRKWALIENY